MTLGLASNFSFLKPHDEQLVRLGRLAESYFPGGSKYHSVEASAAGGVTGALDGDAG